MAFSKENWEIGQAISSLLFPVNMKAANVMRANDRSSFTVYPSDGCGPSFTVKTLRISCQSDTYRGSDHKYGGIIIYARNGVTDWYTANGTHCKSGYVVIIRTDTREFEELQRRWYDEPGQVHGIIYRKAFGESCKGMKVVGEGFGIMNGKFKIISGAFNPADDEYHDNSYLMNKDSARYVEAVVNIWKRGGPNFSCEAELQCGGTGRLKLGGIKHVNMKKNQKYDELCAICDY